MNPSQRELFRFLKPYARAAILAPVFMLGEVALDLMQPRLLQRIVDGGIARGDLGLIQQTGVLMLILAVLGVGAGAGCTVFAVIAAQGFGTDLRRSLFQKVQGLGFGNLDNLESGALITRLTNDVTQVQEMVMLLLRVMVRVPLLLIGSLIMAILTSPRLAILFVPLVPLVAAVMVVIIRKSYPLFGQVQARLDALNIALQENLSGVRVVKAFARQEHEIGRFEGANAALTSKNVEAARLGAATMPLMMLALNAGIVGALWLGGLGVSRGTAHVGQIIAFVNYLTQTLMSLMMVSMLIVRLARAQASATRIGEIMETAASIVQKPGATVPKNRRGHVVFENVSFAYPGGEAVLEGISFEAKPGQTVAILGATGAGKSSLVQLIPRFYDATAGRVLLDGLDVRDWDLDALRGAVGLALQESVLFSGTLRDNIAFGRPDASDEEVLAAARASQADEFIARLPDGYATQVGARGVNLSGGQKQRVAIARALLPGAPLLILDDSTSAVDVATEAKIQAALNAGHGAWPDTKPNLKRGTQSDAANGDEQRAESGSEQRNRNNDQRSDNRNARDSDRNVFNSSVSHGAQTRIIVAQRISSVAGADLILVLEGGGIAARGSHEELLGSSPIYREIYQSQVESGVMAHEIA